MRTLSVISLSCLLLGCSPLRDGGGWRRFGEAADGFAALAPCTAQEVEGTALGTRSWTCTDGETEYSLDVEHFSTDVRADSYARAEKTAERLSRAGYSGFRFRQLEDGSVELFAQDGHSSAVAVRIVVRQRVAYTLVARSADQPHDGQAMRRFLSSLELR